VSSYVTFDQSELTEWEFISEVVKRADCWLLFDVNNVYVSAYNHSFSAEDFLNGKDWVDMGAWLTACL